MEEDLVSQRTSLVALVKSNDVASKVVSLLGSFLSDKEQEPEHLLKMIQVNVQGDLIDISCISTDPAKAARIANIWVEVYEDRVKELYSGIFVTLEELQVEEQAAADQYQIAQAAWEYFTGNNNITELANKINDKALLIKVKSLRDQIAANPTSTASIAANNLSVILLQASAFSTIPEDIQLSPNELAALTTNLDDIDDLIATLETRSETTAGKSVSELLVEIVQLQGELEEENNIQRDKQSARDRAEETYITVTTKADEVALSDLTKDAVVRIASAALEPKSGMGPSITVNVIIGLILGVIIGILATFIIEYYKQNGIENKEGEDISEAK